MDFVDEKALCSGIGLQAALNQLRSTVWIASKKCRKRLVGVHTWRFGAKKSQVPRQVKMP
jgi:hypothetical protein